MNPWTTKPHSEKRSTFDRVMMPLCLAGGVAFVVIGLAMVVLQVLRHGL